MTDPHPCPRCGFSPADHPPRKGAPAPLGIVGEVCNLTAPAAAQADPPPPRLFFDPHDLALSLAAAD